MADPKDVLASPSQPVKVVLKVGNKSVGPTSPNTQTSSGPNSTLASPTSTQFSTPLSPLTAPKKPIFVIKSQTSPTTLESPPDKPVVKKVIFKTTVPKYDAVQEAKKRKSDDISINEYDSESSKRLKPSEDTPFDEGTVITAPKIKKYTPFKKVLATTMKKLVDLDQGNIFYAPVTEQQAPGYSSIIKNPMSLSVMRKRVSQDRYEFLSQMEADFELICSNAMYYNQKDTYYYKKAVKYLNDGRNLFHKMAEKVSPESLKGPELIPSPAPSPIEKKPLTPDSRISTPQVSHNVQMTSQPQPLTVNPDLIVQKVHTQPIQPLQPTQPVQTPMSNNPMPGAPHPSLSIGPPIPKEHVQDLLKVNPKRPVGVNPLMVDWNKKKNSSFETHRPSTGDNMYNPPSHTPTIKQQPPISMAPMGRSLANTESISWDKPWKSIKAPISEKSPNGYNAMALYHQRVYYHKILSLMTSDKYKESFEKFSEGLSNPWIEEKKEAIGNLFKPRELDNIEFGRGNQPVTLTMEEISSLKRLQTELAGKVDLSILDRYTGDVI